MSAQLLQINFRFDLSRSEYEEAAGQLAPLFADLAGLRWKIWILNEAELEAGGIYLFKDEASVQEYLNGPLAAQVKSHPAFSDLSAKVFEVMEEATQLTRGPIQVAAQT